MQDNQKTKEPQNQFQYDTYLNRGPVELGPWTSHIWRTDPRHLGFLLARYKFCAKMLAGKGQVLEVGCGDGFGSPIVAQTVGAVHGIDFDSLIIEDARTRAEAESFSKVSFSVLDITHEHPGQMFDAAFSLDVIEHIPPALEQAFMANLHASLRTDAICLIGTPNVEAQRFATPASAEGHINLKSAADLRALLSQYFHNVFIFSMNDEVVHTGFYPMAHYLFAMGVGAKDLKLETLS
jgi:2-polyprenyl-3-methyl-5-hydroxy-6-metoxy-1,4-benzoquinol methylase